MLVLIAKTFQETPVPVSSSMLMPRNEADSDNRMKIKAKSDILPIESACWMDFLDSWRTRLPTLKVMMSRICRSNTCDFCKRRPCRRSAFVICLLCVEFCWKSAILEVIAQSPQ